MTAALLACAAALPAHAQPCGTRTGGAPTLTAGQTVRGALAREDYTLPGDRYDGSDACTGRPYDSYFYEAQAGERLTFVLESTEIDPEITATTHWRGGGEKDVVNERGRRGRTMTVTGTVPAAGRILIQVASNVSMGRPGSFGDYSFTLRSDRPSGGRSNGGGQASNGGSSGGSELRAGQSARGELGAGDAQLGDESYFEDYTYRARRGERLTVTLESADFDALLYVGRGGSGGTAMENQEVDDDGGGGTNSRVVYTADRDGPVTIRVNSLQGGETGAYTVRLQSGGESAPQEEEASPGAGEDDLPVLTAGRSVRGELAQGDGTMEDGSFFDDYVYMARRGERIVIRLSSDDFDTVLGVIGLDAAGEVREPVMDDDGGGGTNSRVEYRAERDGPLIVRVNSLSAGETGRYTLVAESGRASAAPSSSTDRVASAEPTTRAASLLSAAPPADARLMATSAARPLATTRLARMRTPAMSGRGRAWLMAALGVGMIVGGLKIEETPAEPLGALMRYTGYAVIVFAPFGG